MTRKSDLSLKCKTRYGKHGIWSRTLGRAHDFARHTAKFHVGALIDKLDAVGPTDAVAQAARLGVIHLNLSASDEAANSGRSRPWAS
jgi:DNA-binding CsgD family transcriptional regulator